MEYNYRSPNVNEVTINPDGTIQLVTGTREGVPQDGYFDPYQLTSAATMAVMAGISTRNVTGSTERMKVTDIHSGDWIALRGVNFGNTGAKKFICRVTGPASGKGVIQIRQDSLTGKPIGYVVIEAGQSGEITVELLRTLTGVHDLVFVFSGEGYEFEEWRFSAN
jgi:arabinoxylan arabinofuranohydrolase